MLYAISSSPLGWFGKTPQQLRRGHLAPQHPLALLPHLGRHLAALHADGGLRVLHRKCISFVAALAHRKTPRVIREESGACGRIRTGDLLITSELLCQLSHTSACASEGKSQAVLYHVLPCPSTINFVLRQGIRRVIMKPQVQKISSGETIPCCGKPV